MDCLHAHTTCFPSIGARSGPPWLPGLQSRLHAFPGGTSSAPGRLGPEGAGDEPSAAPPMTCRARREGVGKGHCGEDMTLRRVAGLDVAGSRLSGVQKGRWRHETLG